MANPDAPIYDAEGNLIEHPDYYNGTISWVTEYGDGEPKTIKGIWYPPTKTEDGLKRLDDLESAVCDIYASMAGGEQSA